MIDPSVEPHYSRILGHLADLQEQLPPMDRASEQAQVLIQLHSTITMLIEICVDLRSMRD